jgi:poly [ADP-ribose] polymerase
VKDDSPDEPAKTPAKHPEPAKMPAKEDAKVELKKVIMKGSAPVDQYFSMPSNYRVYSSGGVTYASTLNQSNLSANNNKFYILQIL